jgi:hypothetical protein
MEQERRRSGRRRALVGGTIVLRDGSHTFPCIVRDRTERGARIEISADQLIPMRFWLLTSKDNIAHDAEIAWRKARIVGLRFRGALDVSTAAGPDVQFLKRIKLGAAANSATSSVKAVDDDDSRWPV